MTFLARFIEGAKDRSLSVVLPEGNDDRVIAAARRMKDEGIAAPTLLGKPDEIAAAAAAAGIGLAGIELIDPSSSDRLERYTEAYIEGRDLNPKVALRMVRRPLYFGGMMVASGDADTMVAGVATPTAFVIQAGVLTVGLAEGIHVPSSFFLMVIPDFQGQKQKPFLFADCAVNVAPTPSELADIAIASERSAKRLLPDEPRVCTRYAHTRRLEIPQSLEAQSQLTLALETAVPQYAATTPAELVDRLGHIAPVVLTGRGPTHRDRHFGNRVPCFEPATGRAARD